MAVSQTILGMNARNYLYIQRYNSRRAKAIADDKLETKRLLTEHQIATPTLITEFPDRIAVRNFAWEALPSNGFVIKPARGYGGSGIIVFKSWEGRSGYTITDDFMTVHDIETHILDILDGAHSLQYLPDAAFIEELITPHSFFKKLCPVGLPDIRIIVLHNIPIMAMARIPTTESGGKANLMLGALAVGIDMRTGITVHGYMKHHPSPFYLPGTKTKVRGIKIPLWNELLLLAARTQEASGLGYAGVDLVIDDVHGPLVLEVNARPGLAIQNTNRASLRTRLERIENMRQVTPERGVELAKSLFASPFSEKVEIDPKTIGVIEDVYLQGVDRSVKKRAKIDTGAFRTSIDRSLLRELDLKIEPEKIHVRSASGSQERDAVKITLYMHGKKIRTVASVANRQHLNYPVIIGRSDLKGFLIDPVKNSPLETSTPS